jgi:hypothetical protein
VIASSRVRKPADGKAGQINGRSARLRAAAHVGHLGARMVDENPPHRLRRCREKVRPTLPGHFARPDEFQIRLVDQCRGLERVTGSLLVQLVLRGRSELLIEKGPQRLRRCAVSTRCFQHQGCHFDRHEPPSASFRSTN